MSLSHLIPSIARYAPLDSALAALNRGANQTLADMPEAMRPVIAAIAAERHNGPVLVITSRRDRADAIASAITEYLPAGISLERWAAPDALPFEQLPVDSEASISRTQILSRITAQPDARLVIVAPVHALMQLLMSPSEFREHTMDVRLGGRLDIQRLVTWAASVGYQHNPMVQEPGTIARRGGIVDVFRPVPSALFASTFSATTSRAFATSIPTRSDPLIVSRGSGSFRRWNSLPGAWIASHRNWRSVRRKDCDPKCLKSGSASSTTSARESCRHRSISSRGIW